MIQKEGIKCSSHQPKEGHTNFHAWTYDIIFVQLYSQLTVFKTILIECFFLQCHQLQCSFPIHKSNIPKQPEYQKWYNELLRNSAYIIYPPNSNIKELSIYNKKASYDFKYLLYKHNLQLSLHKFEYFVFNDSIQEPCINKADYKCKYDLQHTCRHI